MEKPINGEHIKYVADKTGLDKETVKKILIADYDYMNLIIQGLAKE